MNRILIIFILASAMAMEACLHKSKEERATNDISDTLHYSVDKSTHSLIKRITIQALISQQQVSVVINFYNNTGTPISIQPQEWELQTSEGNRSLPVFVEAVQRKLEDGQSTKIILLYEPIHSRKLFQLTGLRGDIDTLYTLQVKTHSAGAEKSESVFAHIDRKAYRQGVKALGLMATTQPYSILAGEDFVYKQKSYLSNSNFLKSKRVEHSVKISDNEVLVDGLWLKLQAHTRSDSLYATFRIVNQSAITVFINPSAITLFSGQEKKYPIHSYGTQQLTILNGGRAQFHLRFSITNLTSLNLDLHPFFFDAQNPFPVFCDTITLKEEVL